MWKIRMFSPTKNVGPTKFGIKAQNINKSQILQLIVGTAQGCQHDAEQPKDYQFSKQAPEGCAQEFDRTMRLKYIIPLALMAIMVMAIVPVHASDVQIVQASSEVVNYKTAEWVYLPSGSYDVNPGSDRVYWLNWWSHSDSGYQGTYQVAGYYRFNDTGGAIMRNSSDQVISAYIGYHQLYHDYAYASVPSGATSIGRSHPYWSMDDSGLHQTSWDSLGLY